VRAKKKKRVNTNEGALGMKTRRTTFPLLQAGKELPRIEKESRTADRIRTCGRQPYYVKIFQATGTITNQ
jgi:hypothetical protein